MSTINQVKQLAEADTPILFFDCALPSGTVEYWSSHALMFNGQAYSAQVIKHNLFELQLSGDEAMDATSQLSLTLANADSYLSQIYQETGFKGAQLRVSVAFADLAAAVVTTESTVLFRGVAGDPDEITESALRLTFTNKLALQRIPVPDARIQRTCPWTFPASAGERIEAMNGGSSGSYSRFYRCGYSADVTGGVGNLNGSAAFTTCNKTRTQCQQRGMFSLDTNGRLTSRYGGFEFVPSAVQVRTSGASTTHVSPLIENTAKYNDPVPLVYGAGWLKAPVDFSRNDGNLTHLEVILGLGPIQGVLKVVVNDIEIPQAVPGTDFNATGWYSVVTTGTRNGSFNLDFHDASGNPVGDPFGSIAVLSVVVPNRISTGASAPKVEVLLQGSQIDQYNPEGSFQIRSFSANPAWIILDLLRRSGWSLSELNTASFSAAAQFCSAVISTTDGNGNPVQTPRYECNLMLVKRQSVAAVIRGVRVSSSLMLRYGTTGLLELVPETTLAAQQSALPDGSNSAVPMNGGWPAYEFSDASAAFSGIARNPDGSSSVRLTTRSVAETSNRLSVEFQDAFNEYQQDSLSVVNADDTGLIGYEVSSQSTALGIANMNQATRVLLRQLDKSIDGNLYVQFQTSFRAMKVRPGDIITLTYAKEGLTRVPFRVLKLSPSLNYEMVTIFAQVHDDAWYSDDPAVLASAGRQPGSGLQMPRPLMGSQVHNSPSGQFENFDFAVTEALVAQTDGSAVDTLSISFAVPGAPSVGAAAVPMLSLSPSVSATGGSISDGSTLYYAVSAVDQAGRESSLSFTVAAATNGGTSTNSVTIGGLSFPTGAAGFHVYRGVSPQLLYRIASDVALAGTFTDTGLPPNPIGPPDPHFDHAIFYYRTEVAGPLVATAASATAVSAIDMGAPALAYVGKLARVTEGTGRGQERVITSNDTTTLTINPPWSIIPDGTSQFAITESAWKFAAISRSSPVQFSLPYQPGTVIEVTGRGANVNNLESAPDLCPVTRVALGGGNLDTGTTVPPDYTLAAPGAGLITVSQIGFADTANVSSVSSGTLELFSWNELNDPGSFTLTTDVDAVSTIVGIAPQAVGYVGQVLQVGTELMNIVGVNANDSTYQVARGTLNSTATAHSITDRALHLDQSTLVVPFALNFFENRAATNFIHTINAPDIRVSAALLFVTNAFGDSQGTAKCYTNQVDAGLRTLSGGQFALQVGSSLATQQNAAPALSIDASHPVRDIRASVMQAPAGYSVSVELLQSNTSYCTLTIPPGATVSNTIDGVSLPPLIEGNTLNLNITLNVLPGFTGSLNPGRDLTVTVRL